MSRQAGEDYVGRDVRLLDLRNVKEHAYAARAKVKGERNQAIQALHTGSTSPERARPSTAAASRASVNNQANVAALAEITNRVACLEKSLENLALAFAKTLSSTELERSTHYAVSFGPGAIGMILMSTDRGSVEVAELRDDAAGQPLLAKASGKINVGDSVVAINHHILDRYGLPTLEGVAAEFKGAPRPVTVLFKRPEGAKATTFTV